MLSRARKIGGNSKAAETFQDAASIRSVYADYGTQRQEVAIPRQHGRIEAGRAAAVQKQGVLTPKHILEETRELAKRNF
jgi:hypothetical protein